VLKEIENPERFSLKLNAAKSHIMTNRENMVDIYPIENIPITKSIKYLGVQIFCDKKSTTSSIKTKYKSS
jgi:hypothetical protein